jgi:hypothetical protein
MEDFHIQFHQNMSATPLYPQKLALTSPTSGGRSVGIVSSRTKATELVMSAVNGLHIKSYDLIVNQSD